MLSLINAEFQLGRGAAGRERDLLESRGLPVGSAGTVNRQFKKNLDLFIQTTVVP